MRLSVSVLVTVAFVGVHAARGPIAPALHGKWVGKCRNPAGTLQASGEPPYTCLPGSNQVLDQDYEITYNATHVEYAVKANSGLFGQTRYYAGAEGGVYEVEQEGDNVHFKDFDGCSLTTVQGNTLVEIGTYTFDNEPIGDCPVRDGFDDKKCDSSTETFNYRCEVTKVGSAASRLAVSFAGAVLVSIAVMLVALSM